MATFDSVFIPAQVRATKIAGLATVTASTEQTFGQNEIITINADQNITVRFGAPSNVGTPDATDFLIQAGIYYTVDMGRQWTSLKVFNTSASSVNVYIQKFSKA